jgi:hypothetical protein
LLRKEGDTASEELLAMRTKLRAEQDRQQKEEDTALTLKNQYLAVARRRDELTTGLENLVTELLVHLPGLNRPVIEKLPRDTLVVSNILAHKVKELATEFDEMSDELGQTQR